MKQLLEYLLIHGGKIICTSSLQPHWIEQARASNRMWVDENDYGFVWEPEFEHGDMPTTDKEVELFEWCYPLTVPMPESLSAENVMRYIQLRMLEEKQRENN